jgi:mono/diheme cytochrome c family protein
MGRRLPGLVSFPSIANPDFLALASDDFLAATVRNGRPGRRMPGWLKDGGLRSAEIQAVVAYVRSLGAAQALVPATPALVPGHASNGKRIFEKTCAGCHGQAGKGGEGPALNNKVLLQAATNEYLAGTIRRGRRGTAMASFLEPSPIRPALAESDIGDVVAYLRSLQGGK